MRYLHSSYSFSLGAIRVRVRLRYREVIITFDNIHSISPDLTRRRVLMQTSFPHRVTLALKKIKEPDRYNTGISEDDERVRFEKRRLRQMIEKTRLTDFNQESVKTCNGYEANDST